jgi:integrase
MALRFSRLDRPAIRKLRVDEKITEHGITAERFRDGDVRYSINIMVDGERIHRVIGRESDGTTRTQAEEFIEKARTDARAGRLSLPKGRKTHLTFSKAADDYMARVEESGGKNVRAKKWQLKLHLKPSFRDQQLRTITSFTIEKYRRQRAKEGAAAGTINRELATLSHLFRKAVEWKWLDHIPCKIEKETEDQGRIIALTDQQCDALMKAAVASADPDCWLFVAFGLNTGMRHSEMLRTRFGHLDLDNLRLFVPKAKAGQREQPITKELAAILKAERERRYDQDGWIFATPRPNASLSGHRFRMDKPFRDAVIRAGLDPKVITPHVMRHTAITRLVQSGADLPTIQRISGHKTLAMVLRYTHVHGQHIDRAIAAIGRGIPERPRNETADVITPELHAAKKKPA